MKTFQAQDKQSLRAACLKSKLEFKLFRVLWRNQPEMLHNMDTLINTFQFIITTVLKVS